MLWSSKVSTPQDPLCNLKAIKSLGTSLAWWAHNMLDINRTRDNIAQAYTHKCTQRHMNNAWSEMVSCSPCFAFYCFSSLHWFIQTIWENSYPSWDSHYNLIITSLFHVLLPLYFYWALATSNLMIYLLQVTQPLFSRALCKKLWTPSSFSLNLAPYILSQIRCKRLTHAHQSDNFASTNVAHNLHQSWVFLFFRLERHITTNDITNCTSCTMEPRLHNAQEISRHSQLHNAHKNVDVGRVVVNKSEYCNPNHFDIYFLF
jgi:hypothetical protein